jgi:hypothetical protein
MGTLSTGYEAIKGASRFVGWQIYNFFALPQKGLNEVSHNFTLFRDFFKLVICGPFPFIGLWPCSPNARIETSSRN